jgi:hypothetical protein
MSKTLLVFFAMAVLFAPLAAISEKPKPIVVVFAIETKLIKIDPQLLQGLSDYLSMRLAETGLFQVLPRSAIKDRLNEQKKDSYKECYDQACQIELGRELAAEKTLATQIVKLGSKCKISIALYDLKKAATEKAATHSGKCGDDDLVESLEKLVEKLANNAPSKTAEKKVIEPPKPKVLQGIYLSLPTDKIAPGLPIHLRWNNTPGNKNDWVTIVPLGTPDNKWGKWTYLKGRVTGTFTVTGLAPGDYEARLYYDWPKGKFNVIERLRFKIGN